MDILGLIAGLVVLWFGFYVPYKSSNLEVKHGKFSSESSDYFKSSWIWFLIILGIIALIAS